MSVAYFPRWRKRPRVTPGDPIGIDECLPWPQMIALGVQHVVAMFGSTVLAPLLMGFDPNLCLLLSGIGTLLFFFCVGGRVPSYLGSSFAFISLIITVTNYSGTGPNLQMPIALGGIIACGLLYTMIGLLVTALGTRWIEGLMPPVVTGAIVAVIGLNLAPVAVKSIGTRPFDTALTLITILCVGGVAVFARGLLQRLMILAGLLAAYAIYAAATNGLGLGKPIDFTAVGDARWFGMPTLITPVFDPHAMLLLAPVAIILVAENLGHLKAVNALTGVNLDRYIGRAFIGDGLATVLSGCCGGTGVTTYAENIGVMAVSRVYSTLVFATAALLAILLGFSPKFGAVIHTIPQPVLSGMSIIVFGLIAVTGARIWVVNQVDFSNNRNLIVAATTLILGAGDFSLTFNSFKLGGIGTATFTAILLHALLRQPR